MLNFLKSSDFIRFLVYGGTALGVQLDPAQLNTIVTGGFALSALVHVLRPAVAKLFK